MATAKKASGGTVKKAAAKVAKTVKAAAKMVPGPTRAGGETSASGRGGKVPAKAVKAVKAAQAGKSGEDAESPLKPGQAAPDFRLPDEAGKVHSLADYRGKKVVLYFYPKDSTPGCTTEACDFRDNLARLGEKGAKVLGVSADTVESHRRFKEKQGLNFPLLADPERKALEAYGVWREKSLYGRKFMGIVRTTVLIDGKGRVEKVWPKVKVGGHVDEVLASL